MLTEALCVYLSDSPATLESNLSPAELVPFQGCVIPLLTPQQYFSPEDSLSHSFTEASDPSVQDGAPWQGIAQCQGRAFGDSMEVNNQVKLHCDNYMLLLYLITVVHMIR